MSNDNVRNVPDVVSAYDAWAKTYDSDLNDTRDLAGAVLRESCVNFDGSSVVEVGCGTGQNTLWLAERAERVLGLDISEGMLRQARARVGAQSVRFVQHDITSAWPVSAGAGDVVVAMLVLEHIEHLDAVFSEAARVLRPGGELLLCELHPMRQMLGRRARFTDSQTGQQQKIAAFPHDVSDYVNGGIRAGLTLLGLEERRDSGAAYSEPPRIVSAHFRA